MTGFTGFLRKIPCFIVIVRLGFAKGKPQSEAFWVKNGFAKTGVEVDNGNYIMVVMERCITA